MNKKSLGLLTLGICLALGAVWSKSQVQAKTAPGSDAGPRAVVVELFTSEGCSSCPPADELLARIAERQPIANVHLIVMEEHVDYWNGQGWDDRFSSHEITERQYGYASVLKNGNPYTPQMVVDGTVEFVGSQGQQAQESLVEASRKAKTAVEIEDSGASGKGQENFSVKVGKIQGQSKAEITEVWMAVTETGLHSAVTGGENSGHELRHAAIVRWMHRIGEAKAESETSFAGIAGVSLQKDWKKEALRAVVFVQEKKSRRILGAAELPIAGR